MKVGAVSSSCSNGEPLLVWGKNTEEVLNQEIGAALFGIDAIDEIDQGVGSQRWATLAGGDHTFKVPPFIGVDPT
jgi:hypothetical protein